MRAEKAKMTRSLDTLDPLSLDLDRLALFLDFDGTLVEIARRPDLVRLSPHTRKILGAVHAALGGAVAIVTGRDIGNLDEFLAPLHLPVAGVHGQERRRSDGTMSESQVNSEAIGLLYDRLKPFAESKDGLILEKKSGSLALHYRARPDLEEEAVAAMDDASRAIGRVHLIRGKMVIEAKGSSANKGGAVLDFLSEPPFEGRIPFFAGDDVTDEDAFVAVNARKGITVKIGAGETAATYRAADTKEFLDWLGTMIQQMKWTEAVEQP